MLSTHGRISRALLFEHAPGGFGEGWNTLDPSLVGQRVTAGPRQLAVGEGLLTGFGERDERGGAESEFASPSADDEPAGSSFGVQAGWRTDATRWES